jgi:hypothetical protein
MSRHQSANVDPAHPVRREQPRAEMNERPMLGPGKGAPNVRLWVFAAAEPSIFCHSHFISYRRHPAAFSHCRRLFLAMTMRPGPDREGLRTPLVASTCCERFGGNEWD